MVKSIFLCVVVITFFASCVQKGEENYSRIWSLFNNGELLQSKQELELLKGVNPRFHHKDTSILFLEKTINTRIDVITNSLLDIISTRCAALKNAELCDTSKLNGITKADFAIFDSVKTQLLYFQDSVKLIAANRQTETYITTIEIKKTETLATKEDKIIVLRGNFIGTWERYEVGGVVELLTTYTIKPNGSYSYKSYQSVNGQKKQASGSGTWSLDICDTAIDLSCQKESSGSWAPEYKCGKYFKLSKLQKDFDFRPSL